MVISPFTTYASPQPGPRVPVHNAQLLNAQQSMPFPNTASNPSSSLGFTTNLAAKSSQDKAVPFDELLADPITRKTYHLESAFDDELMRLNSLEKLQLGLKNTFVTLPKTVYHGLRGDSQFTLSDFLKVAAIPYYLGGIVLAGSFYVGRAKVPFARQSVGVLLYFLGMMAANKGINEFYKLKSGIDLDLRYRKPNGNIEKLFASVDFPRLDLLEETDYDLMARKMGVPNNIADRKREVNDQTRQIISAARTDKLILGNLLAAAGAGYIAQSDVWARLLGSEKNLKTIWGPDTTNSGGFLDKLKYTTGVIRADIGTGIKEKISPSVGAGNQWMRKSLLATTAVSSGLLLWHSWQATSGRQHKNYESPFISNLSPALSPEQSSYTAYVQQRLPGGAVNRLPRKGVFDVVQKIESRMKSVFIPQGFKTGNNQS